MTAWTGLDIDRAHETEKLRERTTSTASMTTNQWSLAISQMRRPDAPRPLAREDRNTLIFGAARRLIANSADARCRLQAIAAESGIALSFVRYSICANEEFNVDTVPGDRALWVSLASTRKGRRA